MRRYITADTEWPPEVVEPSVNTSAVEYTLTSLKLKFSPKSVHDILNALRQYPLDIYNEKNNPTKDEQRKPLKELSFISVELQEKLHAFARTDPDPYSSEIYNAIAGPLEELRGRLDLRLKSLTSKGQGKDGGAPIKIAFMILVQGLVLIYKNETGQKTIISPKTTWGRDRTSYNPDMKIFLSDITRLVAPEQSKNISALVKLVNKKPYRPDINLT